MSLPVFVRDLVLLTVLPLFFLRCCRLLLVVVIFQVITTLSLSLSPVAEKQEVLPTTADMEAIKKKMAALKIEKDNALDKMETAENQLRDANMRGEKVISAINAIHVPLLSHHTSLSLF